MRSRSRRRNPTEPSSPGVSQSVTGRRHWRRRVATILLIGLTCLLVTIGCTPRLAGLPFVRQILCQRLSSYLPGTVQIESLHLRWFGPVEIHKLALTSETGEALVAVERLNSERSVWQLMRTPHRWGSVHVHDAQLLYRVRPGGSNWDDFLAKLTPAEPRPGSSISESTQLQVQVHNSVVHLASVEGETATISGLEGWFNLPGTSMTPVTFAVQCQATDSPALESGQLQLEGSWSPARGPQGTAPEAGLKVQLDRWPVGLSRFASIRFGQTRCATGAASGQMQISLLPDSQGPAERVHASLDIVPLQIVTLDGAGEPVDFDTVNVQVEASRQEQHIVFEKCDVRSPLGSVSLVAGLTSLPASASAAELQRYVEQQSFQLDGQLNLAALAQQLPRTLRLRDDVQLKAGVIRWQFASESSDSTPPQWSGRIESEGLVAQRGGETIQLKDPLRIQFGLRLDSQGPYADPLVVDTPFLRLQANGRWQKGQVTAESNLTQLAQELGQFFDLQSLQLAGVIRSDIHWQTTPENEWQLGGTLRGEHLRIDGVGQEAWIEDALQVSFQATGLGDRWPLRTLHSARLDCQAGSDQMVAQLTGAVSAPLSAAVWPLDLQVAGDLRRWRTRMGWASPVPLPRIAGQTSAHAVVRATRDSVNVAPLQVSVRQFELVTADRTWAEPSLEFTTYGSYDLREGTLVCETATLASVSVAGKAEGLRWTSHPKMHGDGLVQLHGDGLVQLHGDGLVQLHGDVAKIWQHIHPMADTRPTGQWRGQVQLSSTSDRTTIRTANRIEGFQWQTRATPSAPQRSDNFRTVWQEPVVQFDLVGELLAEGHQFKITDARCQSTSLGVQGVGDVALGDTPVRLNLQGTTSLNWDEMCLRLRPWLGPDIQLSGTMDKPFRLSGPLPSPASSSAATVQLTAANAQERNALVPESLEGAFGLGWQGFQAYGVVAGAGALDASLQQRALRIQPFEVPVSQGRLILAPQIDMTSPYWLRLDRGPVIEQVAITPAMCHSWLKYLAPLVADATAAEGLFSVRLARAEMPLAAPRGANVAGTLMIHQAHLGPGPLARELLTVAQSIRVLVDPKRGSSQALEQDARWIVLPEQTASFRVEDGRVAHQELIMQVADVTIRTRGWVAFNQQLNLVAEIPVQERWVAAQPYLAGLRGQTLSIPIRGTLQQPKLDQRALQSLSQQAVRGAAQGLLQQELQRQLQQLLPGTSK